jgi:hypothetical protein
VDVSTERGTSGLRRQTVLHGSKKLEASFINYYNRIIIDGVTTIDS